MTRFSAQCARLAVALGAAYNPRHDTIDCCMWPGMPERYRGYVWAIRRNGQYIALGETFKDALAAATRLGRQEPTP